MTTESSADVPAGSAILRAIRILEALAEHERPPQLGEIAQAVSLPKPTVLRILGTLEHAGVVAREPDTKRYGFADRLNQFAGRVLLTSPNRSTRHAILEELVEQIGETCNLTIPNGSTVLYLDRVETAWPLRVHLGPGSRVPLYASASGKLFLSAMPKRSRDRFLAQTPLIRHTGNTLTDGKRLSAEFNLVRERGYSVDNEEYLPGICCVAVPVRNSDGKVVASIAVHAPTARMRLEQGLQYLPQLRSAAEAMTATIDW
jgi:IclR family transcriptional regulator, acetate operon repressor